MGQRLNVELGIYKNDDHLQILIDQAQTKNEAEKFDFAQFKNGYYSAIY